MKRHFVKTENHTRLAAAARMMAERGSLSACLCLVEGKPGVGKTRNISHWGAAGDAVLVKGHVGMTLGSLRWAVSEQLGLKHSRSNASQEIEAQIAALREHGKAIVFDEAQYGLAMRHNGVRQAGIEYLRDIAERAGTFVFLVVHESEVRGFAETAHIKTRIAHRCKMSDASEADTALFVRELCEIAVDDSVIKTIYKQTGGRYRLMENAITMLEKIASKAGVGSLTAAVFAGTALVVDHEAGLLPRQVKGAAK